jgi:hypothetical protein
MFVKIAFCEMTEVPDQCAKERRHKDNSRKKRRKRRQIGKDGRKVCEEMSR